MEVTTPYASPESTSESESADDDVEVEEDEDAESSTEEPSGSNNTEKKPFSIFNFIPFDIIRRVHQKFMAQPKTLQGKLEYLKDLKRRLMELISIN